MTGATYFGTYTNGIVLSDAETRIAPGAAIYNTGTPGTAVLGQIGSAWAIANYGTISGSNLGFGIELRSAGDINNVAGGYIAGAYMPGAVATGIVITGGPATIANAGLIKGGILAAGGIGTVANGGSIQGGIDLEAGGAVSNEVGGVILGQTLAQGGGLSPGVSIAGGTGTVTNVGVIAGAVVLAGGGTVTNQSLNGAVGGTIGGAAAAFGITIGGPGTVTNYGVVTAGLAAPAGAGVAIAGPGVLLNIGVIQDLAGTGVAVAGPAALTNDGAILGDLIGVDLGAGGSTLVNSGTITAATGILAAGPDLIRNFGTIAGSSGGGEGAVLQSGGQMINRGVILGDAVGLYVGGTGGSVANYDTITATGVTGIGVAGGQLSLLNSGTITAATGVFAAGPGLVSNFGTIATSSGGGKGIVLQGGGQVVNHGLILGDAVAIEVGGTAGMLANYDTITATGATGIGVAGGQMSLLNAGTISGEIGVALSLAHSTVTQAGTVVGRGGTAVALAGGDDLLVVDPGAVFVGSVAAAGSGNTLELAHGPGGQIALGKAFTGFGTVRIDAGASWNIAGGGSNFVNDGTVVVAGALSFGNLSHDPGASGVIDLGNSGTAAFVASVDTGETLVFTDNTGVAVLDQPYGFKATIAGFAAGDVIDLVGIQADKVRFKHDTLVLLEGHHKVADVQFAGQYTKSEFSLSPDGNGGTDITLLPPTAASFWTMRG